MARAAGGFAYRGIDPYGPLPAALLELYDPPLENIFRDHVVRLARQEGWLAHFTWNSRHSPDGEPDVRLYRGDRIVFAELKRGDGTVSDAQERALRIIAATGKVEVFLWYPRHWNEICRVLA